MRIHFSILVTILLPCLAFAQSPNFFRDGARWVYYTWQYSEPGQETSFTIDQQIVIQGDTVIEDQVYAKLYTTTHHILNILVAVPPHPQYVHTYDSTGPTFLRYDTLLKKVFYLPDVDSTERLIYDFTLEVGDTTPMQPPFDAVVAIDSTDMTDVFGIQARRFFPGVEMFDDPWNNYIIEGIGGSNGLIEFNPYFLSLSGGSVHTHLVCFQYEDQIFSQQSECPFIQYVSVEPVKPESLVVVGPNPAHEEVNITIGPELWNATFSLVDYLGRIVHTCALNDLNTVVPARQPGMYAWYVEHHGRLVKAGRLVVQ